MRTIDFVAPPYAGHLFPAIQLAGGLSQAGAAVVRIVSTPSAAPAVRAAGLEFVEVLSHHDDKVRAIADVRHQIGSNPFRLWSQLQQNLSLMGDLKRQLYSIWELDPPDLVIADFVVPVAGFTAEKLGINWWTGMATPCALETRNGVPSYLGGWKPHQGALWQLRNRGGRLAVRAFKRSVAFALRKQFHDLGIERLYRADGTEAIYSPHCILGYGIPEFEFNTDWPHHFHFTGPLFQSPLPIERIPEIGNNPTVLVSLGTHLPWAKDDALALITDVARVMPDIDFHFSRGTTDTFSSEVSRNVSVYSYIPYGDHLQQYVAAIMHGGAGITYACMENSIPVLAWPHDYDQFDHAARIAHRGLGKRLKPTVQGVTDDLQDLLTPNKAQVETRERFKSLCQEFDAVKIVAELLNQMC